MGGKAKNKNMAVHIEVWEFREGSYFLSYFISRKHGTGEKVDEHLTGGCKALRFRH